ncbi:isochorismatase family protein [Paenibacillus thalictri]|uniref:Isochorismatase family protein n=1 Tax=Paenibacillus thalictri TaxID=2527873 RepID=A0A4V2J4E3_9BACL|nr:isochorismatase family protein [Paenibacillus thalictri]TBL79472.1 isochorismatase family protein [Paenibacillus thalictri]
MNENPNQLGVTLQTQELAHDAQGYLVWKKEQNPTVLEMNKTAIILSDLWDLHWCRGAAERLLPLLGKINEVNARIRNLGGLVVHAPSNTMEFYDNTPARNRLLEARPIQPPKEKDLQFPPLPIDDSDGGSDTNNNFGKVNENVWTRQHPEVHIDPSKDIVCGDEGEKLYSLFTQKQITTLLFAGVHTNMCILNRSFGIKQMLRWGFKCILIRDLTDAMYNPAMRPYVSHEQGTELVVEYIEKFVCPTVASPEIIA